jgi:hypothetical protein
MITNKDKRPTGMHRLFVKVRDPSKEITINRLNGVREIPVMWKEVSEINLGSKKNPTKGIYEVKLVWERFEPDGSRMNEDDFFRRFLGGF